MITACTSMHFSPDSRALTGANVSRGGSGGRTRTPNDRARTCCVADYTTPERVEDMLADWAGSPESWPGRATCPGSCARLLASGARYGLPSCRSSATALSRAEARRDRVRSRPSKTNDSNSGGPTLRPVTANRIGA